MIEPVVLVHGGAWGVPDAWIDHTIVGVKSAARIGYDVLKSGGSALDAVEAAVRSLEDDEYFNAGIVNMILIIIMGIKVCDPWIYVA